MTTTRNSSRPRQTGMALIAVMIAVTVLSILAAAFAYAMKVETKLAQNADSETELIWLGRSGVEFARYVLAMQLSIGNEPYDGLNQKWAGGPGGIGTSNSVLAEISLKDYRLGNGSFSVTIKDLERKANINMADERINRDGMDMLQQALRLVGVDAGESSSVAGSIMDWIDEDNNTHNGGAEKDYYQNLDPPYLPKNTAMDDLSELLLVKGILDHPEIYWGGVATNHALAAFQNRQGRLGQPGGLVSYGVGLEELFTPLSNGRININTASQTTLQMIPFVDEMIAAKIIELRSGMDGADGTEDDMPAGMPGITVESVLLSAGMSRQVVPLAASRCTTRSSTFEVQVDAEVAGYHRQFFAILGRTNPRDVQILSFYWK